jgi:CBS domain-containing protein
MKVKDVMTSDVKSCGLGTNLAAAAKIMWDADCGAVPVIDDRGHVVGVITDRDICLAAATRSRSEGEIAVTDVISRTLHACAPDDDVRTAMDKMKKQQVRRLPVIGTDGRLTGIVSLHDFAVQARPTKNSDIRAEDVLETLVAITAPSRSRATVAV